LTGHLGSRVAQW